MHQILGYPQYRSFLGARKEGAVILETVPRAESVVPGNTRVFPGPPVCAHAQSRRLRLQKRRGWDQVFLERTASGT